MLAQRVMQQSLRRAAFQQPTVFTRAAMGKLAPRAVVAATIPGVQRRHAATQNVSQAEGQSLLTQQRLQRPVSPHLSIYRKQIQFMTSGLNRITGSVLSGAFYIFGFSYLVAPLFGWHIESTAMAAAFGALPLAAKAALKFTVALPFTFHSFNSMRHFFWDAAKGLGHKQWVRGGFVISGLSILTAGVLAYI